MGIFIRKKLIFIFTIIFLSIFSAIIVFFDEGLAVGIIILIFLAITTLLSIKRHKTLFSLILIIILLHLVAVLFLHYADFFPFGPGRDDLMYHQIAAQLAERWKSGDFYLGTIPVVHYYPILIGALYTLSLPEIIIGQLFSVWLTIVSIILVYLLVIEIGGSKKWAFFVGLITGLYPSYLFYGSLLLKDTLVIPLSLLGILLIIKIIKFFKWRNFFIFLMVAAILLPLRFYAGILLLMTFFISWLIFSKIKFKKKIIYGLFLIIIFGFLADFLGYGFFGERFFKEFLNPEYIAYYRQVAYKEGGSTLGISIPFNNPISFLGGFLNSFLNVLLGPFPWQVMGIKYLLALVEIIIWYLLLIFIIRGGARSLKFHKESLPLILFSLGLMIMVALISDNIGTTTRLRMSAFIALFCLIPFGFETKIKKVKSICAE